MNSFACNLFVVNELMTNSGKTDNNKLTKSIYLPVEIEIKSIEREWLVKNLRLGLMYGQ